MPANTMVVGLGGYKFKDYAKSGPAADSGIVRDLYDPAADSFPILPVTQKVTKNHKFLPTIFITGGPL